MVAISGICTFSNCPIMDLTVMPQHIGIVACSAEGAALCYRTICVEGAPLLGRPHAHPEVSMHTHSLAEYMACIYRGDWQGVGELMLASAEQAREDRRRFPDLPGQHHPPGAALRRTAIAAALAAYRRGRRRRGRRARLPAPRPDRHTLAGRERGLSGEADGARAGLCAPERRRTRGNQPHHHG